MAASLASPSAPAPSSRCSAGLGGSRRRSPVPPAPQAQVNVNKVRNALVANRSVFKLFLTELNPTILKTFQIMY